MCAQNIRELTPPGAETFIFSSFSRHIENSLTRSFQQCYRSQCVVLGSAVSIQIAKSNFLSATRKINKKEGAKSALDPFSAFIIEVQLQ
jgi:hypothetical protein